MLSKSVLVTAALLTGFLLMAGCPPDEPDEVDLEVRDVEAATVEVTRRSFDAAIDFGGGVVAAPGLYAEVGCAVCPPVAETLVQAGDAVQAGDPLARLAGGYPPNVVEELESRLAVARDDRRSAEQNLNEAVNDTRAVLQSRRDRLETLWEADSDEEPQELTAEIAAAERAAEQAEIALEMAENARDNLLARHDARIAQLEAELQTAREGVGEVTLRSPIDGTVTDVYLEEGELPLGRMSMIVVADLAELHVEATVTELYARQLEPGLEAIVNLSTRPADYFEGETIWVSPPVEPEDVRLELPEDGAHIVLVGFENTDGVARPGDAATVILRREVEDALVLPTAAVEFEEDQAWVYVDVAGDFVRRPVVAGPGTAEWTVIEQGLAEGDLVAFPEAVEAVREMEPQR